MPADRGSVQIVASTATARPPSPTNAERDRRVAAIVVHAGSTADTIACVASIQEHAPGLPILLVDDVGDASAEDLRQRFAAATDLELLAAGDRRGFGAASNRAIERALHQFAELEHALLLRPTARVRPGAVTAMRACAQHHGRAGIVGCRIVATDGEPWIAARPFPQLTGQRLTAPSGGATEFETEFIADACMLIDAGMLRRGLRFDPAFASCGADADLCRRAHALGRTTWITRAATVEHQAPRGPAGQCADDDVFWFARASVMLARRHLPPLRRLVFLTLALPLAALQAALRRHGPRWLVRYARGVLAGLRAGPVGPATPAGPPVN